MSDSERQPRSVSDLCELEVRGHCPDFLFFWGHRPPRDGGVGAGCLSQWWPALFIVSGVLYPSAEHFMMAGKARLFGDEFLASRIINAPSPGDAKALGRAVDGFSEELWTANRYGIVVEGNMAKFGQNPALLAYLRTTGGRVLVEASSTDRVWGIGLAADDERAGRPSRWQGMNLLGFALMQARGTLG
ncbi:MAG: NADAR family protein [Actinomycetota bacterium]|nr:NADAR family protein [Actinomycetota bacterium]